MAKIDALVTNCATCPFDCNEYGCRLGYEQLYNSKKYPGVPEAWQIFSFCCKLKRIEYVDKIYEPERKHIVYE